MGVRWLVNAVLLAAPIGTTVGILVGIDAHRQASGQALLFTTPDNGGSGNNGGGITGIGGDNGGGTSSGTPIDNPGEIDNGFTTTKVCNKTIAIAPNSKGSQYILNPNQWGWTENTPGSLCMNFTALHNKTYPTASTAPKFSVTWQYPQGPESAPVHAFPNAEIVTGLPVKLQSVKQINVDMKWTYGVGSTAAASTSVTELTANALNTNVAIDMFLDNDKTTALNNTLAKFEIMVWFAKIGPAAQPIGYKDGTGSIAQKDLNGVTFNLFAGENGHKQTVLTWLASKTTEAFTGDLAPLLNQIYTMPNAGFPTGATYLGHLGLGTEAFSANLPVTFDVPTLSIDIQT